MTFGLAENFPEEIPDAFADMGELKSGVFSGFQDLVDDDAKALPEERRRGDDQGCEEQLFKEPEMIRFGEEKLRHEQLASKHACAAGRNKVDERGHRLFVESSRLRLYLIGGIFGTRPPVRRACQRRQALVNSLVSDSMLFAAMLSVFSNTRTYMAKVSAARAVKAPAATQ